MTIDPSNFLWALKYKISSARSAPFDFNFQQDVGEILQVVFEELMETSITINDLLTNTLRTTIICSSTFCFADRKERRDTVSVAWLTMSIVPLRNFFHLSY